MLVPLSPLGLLLDVDGPIASPVTRTIASPSIITDLITLAGANVPIAFVTGRSVTFIEDQVVDPLRAAGLPGTMRMYGVCEKGAVWFPITADGIGVVVVDDSVALPAAAIDAVRRLVIDRFADTMFFDETKQAMVSVEQRTDADDASYRAAAAVFTDAAFSLLTGLGLGLRFGDRVVADANGRSSRPTSSRSRSIRTGVPNVRSPSSPHPDRCPASGVPSVTRAAIT
jgi:hypothetical protein